VPQPVILTISTLAAELAMDRATVVKRLAGLAPVRTRGQVRYYRMGPAVRACLIGGDGATDSTFRARQTRARAELDELTLAERKGELIDRRVVIEEAFTAWRARRQELEQLLVQLAPILAAEAGVEPGVLAGALEREGRAFLSRAADAMDGRAAELEAAGPHPGPHDDG
jgi:hypothetical protein